MKLSKTKFKEIKELCILIIVALTIKTCLIEIYVVPTGSMEKTILIGDMLFGNKFIYGMRTPDWIGIPYSRIGFDIPWMRFPKFRNVKNGDVVIFEFPRDPFQKYVKRCIGTPGDLIVLNNGKIFINQEEFPFPEEAKYIHKNRQNPIEHGVGMFSKFQGNKDNISSFLVRYKGLEINFESVKDWNSIITLLVQEGNNVTISEKSFNMDHAIRQRTPFA